MEPLCANHIPTPTFSDMRSEAFLLIANAVQGEERLRTIFGEVVNDIHSGLEACLMVNHGLCLRHSHDWHGTLQCVPCSNECSWSWKRNTSRELQEMTTVGVFVNV